MWHEKDVSIFICRKWEARPDWQNGFLNAFKTCKIL